MLAIDVGGTKMAAGVVDQEGNLIRRVAKPTPVAGSAEELFGVLMSLVEQLGFADRASAALAGLVGCGVGCGGPMTGSTGGRSTGAATGGGSFHSEQRVLVSPLNIPGWRSFPLAERVAELTGLQTTVDNDAKAFALGEGWVGAAAGESDYIGMVVSTGVGGGIVCNGRLLAGADGNAGHIGQIVVRPQDCGDTHQPPGQIRGVLEAECSGTSIASWTGKPAKEASDEIKIRTGRLVGQAVGSTANLLDLRLAVVGGSVGLGFGELFFSSAQLEIDRVCDLDYSRGTKILSAGNGDASPLIGAGALAFRAQGMQLGAVLPN